MAKRKVVDRSECPITDDGRRFRLMRKMLDRAANAAEKPVEADPSVVIDRIIRYVAERAEQPVTAGGQ